MTPWLKFLNLKKDVFYPVLSYIVTVFILYIATVIKIFNEMKKVFLLALILLISCNNGTNNPKDQKKNIDTVSTKEPTKKEVYLIYINKKTGDTLEYTSKTLPWQDTVLFKNLEFVKQKIK